MLIDLTDHYTRFNIERWPESLVVLIPSGEIRGPLRQQLGVITRLTPIHEEAELLGFRLEPTGDPSYEDADAKGWEYNVSMHQRGRHVQIVLRLETSGHWVVRAQGQLGAALDVTMPQFQPSSTSYTVTLGQESLRWRTLREMNLQLDEDEL